MSKLLFNLFYNLGGVISISFLLLQFNGCGSGSYDVEEVEEEQVEDTTKYEIKLEIKTEETTDDYVISDVRTDNNYDEKHQYTIQVGAFYYESNSLPYFNEVKASMKYQTYYKYMDGLYKIQVGLFNNKGEALKVLEEIISLGYTDSFITETK